MNRTEKLLIVSLVSAKVAAYNRWLTDEKIKYYINKLLIALSFSEVTEEEENEIYDMWYKADSVIM